jgi:hypothetical protein
MTQLGGVVSGGGPPTLIVIVHETSAFVFSLFRGVTLSFAVKVMTWEPVWFAAGVQLKTLCTGLPDVGSAGVIVAPAGNAVLVRVTVFPASASEALTVKVNACPTFAVNVVPHVGVGETNSGGTLVGGFVTLIVNEHNACALKLSVAVNVTTNGPT